MSHSGTHHLAIMTQPSLSCLLYILCMLAIPIYPFLKLKDFFDLLFSPPVLVSFMKVVIDSIRSIHVHIRVYVLLIIPHLLPLPFLYEKFLFTCKVSQYTLVSINQSIISITASSCITPCVPVLKWLEIIFGHSTRTTYNIVFMCVQLLVQLVLLPMVVVSVSYIFLYHYHKGLCLRIMQVRQ